MMDFDPQINLVQSFNLGSASKFGQNLETLIKNFVEGKEINLSSYIIKVSRNMDLLPSSNNISLIEEYLTDHIINRTFKERIIYRSKYRNQIIKKVLEDYIPESSYDYILIDSQPNYSLLSTSSIVYAKNIMVVIRPELFSFLDIKYLQKIIRSLEKNFYVNIKIVGVIINSFEKRKKDARFLAEELQHRYGDSIRIYQNKIRYLSDYQKSIAVARKPVFTAYPGSEAAQEMLKLCAEIAGREDEFYFK